MRIDMHNYEEWMIAYVDGELKTEEAEALQDFLEKHPVLQEDLAIFRDIVFKPDETITFDNKTTLYKSTTHYWSFKKIWPMAAAIVMLLCAWPLIQLLQKTNQQEIARNVQAEKKVENPTTTPTEKLTETVAKNTTHQSSQPPTVVNSYRANKKVIRKQMTAVVQNKHKEVEKINSQEQAASNQHERSIVKQKALQINGISEDTIQIAIPKADQELLAKKEDEYNAPKLIAKVVIPATKTTQPHKSDEKALIVFSAESTPIVYDKVNEVVAKVEDNIEFIKSMKHAPITVSIGNRKIFTLNN